MDGNGSSRVYMDNAATSWPKSQNVLQAVQDYLGQCGATAGRGSYRSAVEAESWVTRARQAVAKLIGARPDEIAFCTSGTHALNAALHGMIHEGDQVVTCELEHNSVLRPLWSFAAERSIALSVAPITNAGILLNEELSQYLSESTNTLVLGHASNVTGWATDLHALSIPPQTRFVVDASQTVGYLPLDVNAAKIDVLAAAGHKGLGAIGGTGFVYVRRELQQGFAPLLRGGTGRNSHSTDAEPEWPENVEVGNLNLPGIVSMAVAAENLLADVELSEWKPAFSRLLDGLQKLSQAGVQVVGGLPTSHDLDQHVPVVSLLVDGWDVHDLAAILDSSFGIEARAGWHCAALAHRPVGTEPAGGTLRLSTGRYTTTEQVDYVLECLGSIVS